MITQELRDEMRAVIDNLESREWIQGELAEDGAVCAHGAVQTCQGIRAGDEHIIRSVMRTRGITEVWNDEEGRTKAEVLLALRAIEVTDADLNDIFGPQWREIVALVRRVATVTPGEVDRLGAAWAAVGDAARSAAMDAARSAARSAAMDAAGSAAWALSARHLIGQQGLSQEHYDILAGPMRRAIGPLHLDDASMGGGDDE